MIKAQNISKLFGDLKALDGVDFKIDRGELILLCGSNASGKTTLINILSGRMRQDAGEILIGEASVDADALINSCAVVTQEPELAEDLSVIENIVLGREAKSISRLANTRYWKEKICRTQRQIGSELNLNAAVSSLGVIDRQYVSLIKSIIDEKPAILLDEPFTGLSEIEAEPALRTLKKISEMGVAIVLVSHRRDMIARYANRIVHLEGGKVVQCEGMSVFPGRSRNGVFLNIGGPVIEICETRDALTKKHLVHEGEVIGLTGTRMEAVGKVFLSNDIIEGAIQHGRVSYVTSDRLRAGVFPDLCVADNLVIRVVKTWLNRVVSFEHNDAFETSKELAASVGLLEGNLRKFPKVLSGGNQQRVILGRGLSTRPKIMYFDNATRGLDEVGKEALITQIMEYVKQGGACVVVAPELDFLKCFCNQIIELDPASESKVRFSICF